MLTKQHIAIFVLAMISKGKDMKEIMNTIPYVALPDAIRMYIKKRQPSHFEKHPYNKNDVSWVIFPEEESLKNLSQENSKELIKYNLADNIPLTAVGEETDIDAFDEKNQLLKYYHEIKIHLIQDRIFDKILRDKIIDVTKRFEDSFTIKYSGKIVNGSEIRTQITLFEKLGFIKLVGIIWKQTGILLDKNWFDNHVQKALYDAYDKDMANNTYRFMEINDELDQRLKNHKFELSQEEKDSVYIVEDLDIIWDLIYEEIYRATFEEI